MSVVEALVGVPSTASDAVCFVDFVAPGSADLPQHCGRLPAGTAMPQGREFAAGDLGAALAYIDGLPEDVRRVYMDVRDERGNWCCVYGDERSNAHRVLGKLIEGRSFRLRGTDIPRTIQ
jgi:hypothetical protein